MDAIIRKFFDQKAGLFLDVAGRMEINLSQGEVIIEMAKLKSEVFDNLHLPVLLRGGYIDKMKVKIPPMGLFTESNNTNCSVEIKGVFLVCGPNTSDWIPENVCKTMGALVNLAMKVYDLKPPATKKKKERKGGYFADMKGRMVEEFKKKLLGSLDVNISRIHVRYEDALTQTVPFAFGGRIGSICVESSKENEVLRVSGEWRQGDRGPMALSDPLLKQSVHFRQIGFYWDMGLDKTSFFPQRVPLDGAEVQKSMNRLFVREAFSAAVVDKLLEIFPRDHSRRKRFGGPTFRDRLDYHQYILFPMQLGAHVMANRKGEPTKLQKTPVNDIDVVVDNVEVSMDSEQVRSVNELMCHLLEFRRQNILVRTRPKQHISACMKGGASDEKKAVVKSWWIHAKTSVNFINGVMKVASLNKEAVMAKGKLREDYINLVIAELEAVEKGLVDELAKTREQLEDMQLLMDLSEALELRTRARDRRAAPPAEKEEDDTYLRGASGLSHASRLSELSSASGLLEPVAEDVVMPSTMQAHFFMGGFSGYFFMKSNAFSAIASSIPERKGGGEQSRRHASRQLLIEVLLRNLEAEMVQKGSKDSYKARWFQFGVGSCDVVNVTARKSPHRAREMVTVESISANPSFPLCVFVGFNTFEVLKQHDASTWCYDGILATVMEPESGTAAHVKDIAVAERGVLLGRMAPLKAYKEDPGKLMMCGFVRVGQARALYFTPVINRLLEFARKGRPVATERLSRQPSVEALDKELLTKLQRRVQLLTGKSGMMGVFDVSLDGAILRMVDKYNSQNVLCKEMTLAPMRIRAFRNGNPQTLHIQCHQMDRPHRGTSLLHALMTNTDLGMLPWRVAIMLLPRADFKQSLEGGNEDAEEAEEDGSQMAVLANSRGHGSLASSAGSAPRNSGQNIAIVITPTCFKKWGRNGKCKERYVWYSSELDAIVWTKRETDKSPVGLIQIQKVQDICRGATTPVLAAALRKGTRGVNEDNCFSIVTLERTLDLQADGTEQRDNWVEGLKAQYRKRMHVRRNEKEQNDLKLVEKATKSRSKYPEKFRSHQCELASSFHKLQAIRSFNEHLRFTEDRKGKEVVVL